ncbi:hypothetical protein O181_038932 [Austropuccinia psidii MF-1]|uniref:Uncharacterized protein n=1 Tax=Austropuccinia psidii MF-1 TaxID=1389203 RepID=A0A9Q3DFQ5_9BASI|nr:hypothetical protein [Austropuccinia psidii MF-1]
MNSHSLDRRQQAFPSGGGAAVQAWALRARVLGLDPAMPNDLIASMLFSILFAVLAGACVFAGRARPYRTLSMYTLFAASVLLFLAFAIRAGIANSTLPTRTSFIVECLFLVLAQLCILDVWIMRSRDELIDFLEFDKKIELRGDAKFRDSIRGALFNSETRFAFVARLIILPLCLLLYLIGYITLPDLATELPNTHSSRLRGTASFLTLFLLAMMNVTMIGSACLEKPHWIPQVILFGTAAMLWLPALYAFCLIAITVDSSSIVQSTAFFYAGFGFAHAVAIMTLIAMNRMKRLWVYRVGPDFQPDGGPPPPRPFYYLPPGVFTVLLLSNQNRPYPVGSSQDMPLM